MHRWFFVSFICIFGVLAFAVRANAAPANVRINNSAILRVKFAPGNGNDQIIGVRLQRGIFRHGHINGYRTLSLTAYDENGIIIASKNKRIGKRQTYTHVDVPPSFAKASDITVSLQ
jgi:hypothetical protein